MFAFGSFATVIMPFAFFGGTVSFIFVVVSFVVMVMSLGTMIVFFGIIPRFAVAGAQNKQSQNSHKDKFLHDYIIYILNDFVL